MTAEAITRLDLGECETREELVEALQSCRAFQLESLTRWFPGLDERRDARPAALNS